MYRTQKLAEKINSLISTDEIFPICIASYKRPDATLLKLLHKKKKLNVILFIRTEEYEDYASRYGDKFKIVRLKNVDNVGDTRRAILRWLWKHEIDECFLWDDDICELDFVYPSYTSGGNLAMRPNHVEAGGKTDIYIKAIKMWIFMLRKCKKPVALSAPLYRPYSWHMKNSELPPIKYNCRDCIQCVYLNTKLLKEYGICYRDEREVGPCDLALQFEIMTAGLYTVAFTDLMYGCPPMGEGVGGCNASEYEILFDNKSKVMKDRVRRFFKNVPPTPDHKGLRVKNMKNGWKSVAFNWKYWKELS